MGTIYQNIAQEAIKSGLDVAVKMFENTIKPTKDEVKNAAEEFCKKYREFDQAYSRELRIKELQAQVQGNTVKSSTKKSIRSVLEYKYVREAYNNFQNIINQYFGQVMLLMYVYIDPNTGAVQLGLTENSIEHFRETHGGRIGYYLESVKDILFQWEKNQYDPTWLDAAEQSIYTRMQIAKGVTNKTSSLPVLWYINHQWEGAIVNNLGTIAEAYVNFYLNKYEFSKQLEKDVKTYILDPTYGALSVDNASGFLIGDYSYQNILHFAVKKEDAAPGRLSDIYLAVQSILNDPAFNIEQLKQQFIIEEREKAQSGGQVTQLAEAIEQTHKELIQKEIENKIVKIN